MDAWSAPEPEAGGQGLEGGHKIARRELNDDKGKNRNQNESGDHPQKAADYK